MATLGFIGLGVMGGPMCRNMALKHDDSIVAHDLDPAAAEALAGTKAEFVSSIAAVTEKAEIVFLSLPGGPQLEAVCRGPNGILSQTANPKIVVDFSTAPVALTREIAAALGAKGIAFADAPVARTREAAQRGALSVMVGAPAHLFAELRPLLAYVGTDISHCGDVGAGQVTKLINNALLIQNVCAIAEMLVVGERAGVTPDVLLDVVSKGSGDSFALRNHAVKAMLPRTFPERAFALEYAAKDLAYALELARDAGVSARGAELAKRYLEASIAHGLGGKYFPAVIEFIEAGGLPD